MNARAAAVVAALAVAASAVPARAGDGDRWDGATIGVQVGAGAGGMVLGGGVGLVAGLLIGAAGAKKGEWGRPFLGGLLGSVVGGEAGILIGVQHYGDERGGTGKVWGTLLGGAGGIVAGGFALYYGARANLSYPTLTAIAVTFAIGGPIVGYQLSADAHASTTARVVPLVTLAF